MRVAYVITSLSIGGAESMLTKVVLASRQPPSNSLVICLGRDGAFGETLRSAGVATLVMNMGPNWGTIKTMVEVVRQLRAWRPDILHGWMYHGNLAATLLKVIVCRYSKLVWNVRQSLYSLKAEKRLTRLVIRCGALLSSVPTAILYNSLTARVHHAAIGFSDTKAQVIGNGFDLDRFLPNAAVRAATRQLLGIGADEFVIGIVGRWHPVKDHDMFLRACSEVSARGYAARYLLVGPGCGESNRVLQSRIEELRLADHVVVHDSWRSIETLYPALDAYCMASKSEGFPNALGEAMAAGLCCVATDVGDCKYVLRDAGGIVQSGDATAMADALVRFLRMSSEERNTLGDRARHEIASRYSLATVVTAYEELHESVFASA